MAKISERLKDALDTKTHPKIESYALVKTIKDELAKELPRATPRRRRSLASTTSIFARRIFREQVLKDRIRPDRRAFDEIRQISIETGVLPRTHGSALFTRGETQALVTAHSGHHRRFAAAGDLRRRAEEALHAALQLPAILSWRNRPHDRNWPSRDWSRSIGRARDLCRPPGEEESPYTVRIVSDILESNGSSSMATVCGASLALMDAGSAV